MRAHAGGANLVAIRPDVRSGPWSPEMRDPEVDMMIAEETRAYHAKQAAQGPMGGMFQQSDFDEHGQLKALKKDEEQYEDG